MTGSVADTEITRLDALRGCEILDTPPEAAFDDFARLAAQLCHVPVALISLVDEDRQWFKARVGLDICETSREVSFCAHALGRAGLFLVPDAATDPRFFRNPLVTGEPYIRFYAGAPLVTSEGHALGTLCVVDHVPRELTSEQQHALEMLARQVVAQLELRRGLRERARTEVALRESEAMNAAMLESALDAIVTIDEQDRVLQWNPAAERIFGRSRAEALGRLLSDLIVPEALRSAHKGGIVRSLATGDGGVLNRRIEVPALRADGTEFPAELTALPIQLENRWLFTAYVRDITDRRQAEENLCQARDEMERRVEERTAQLTRAEENYRSLFENAVEGIFQTTVDGRYLSANPALARLYGHDSPSDLIAALTDIGRSLYVDPGRREDFVQLMHEGGVVSNFESAVRRKDGSVIWVAENALAVRDEGGAIVRYEGTVVDITERRQAQEALRASEERLRTVVSGAPLILYAVDSEGVFTFSDGRGLNALGLAPGQVVGRSVFDVYRGHDHVLASMRRVLAGETVTALLDVDGSVFETMLSPQCDAAGVVTGAVGVSLDVTERQWAEREIFMLNTQLEQRLDSITALNDELRQAYDATIEGWSRALDLRDHETEGHSRRVTDLTVRLAEAFGIGGDDLVQVRRGALLHDIGKMGVPDGILLKPGPLTQEERAAMERHPGYALDMLSPITFLRPALEIPFFHHERWDGQGYPNGLRGEDIPLAARLFAVVDVWDALRSDRPYRKAWPVEKTRRHIAAAAGTHFDPAIVRVFLTMVADEAASEMPCLLAA